MKKIDKKTGPIPLETPSSEANGTSVNHDAHANGINFEQSIGQQQKHFEVGLSSSSKNIKQLLGLKRKKCATIKQRSDLRYLRLVNKLNNR